MPTSEEMEEIEFNILQIDRAIQKSVADNEYTLHRGIRDIKWLKNPIEGGTFTEDAFGSFTLSFNKAFGYSNPENLIMLRLKLDVGENVLYLDHGEKEMLRPRDSTYEITEIKDVFIETFNKMAKIYYIEILKE